MAADHIPKPRSTSLHSAGSPLTVQTAMTLPVQQRHSQLSSFEALYHPLPLRITFNMFADGLTEENRNRLPPVFTKRDEAYHYGRNLAQQSGFNIRIKTSTVNDNVSSISLGE